MKTMRYYSTSARICVLLVVALVAGCKKNVNEELALSRQFSPSTVTGTNGETAVKLTWSASLFTLAGDATYSIEVAPDAGFTAPIYTTTTNDLSIVLSDDKLDIRKDYYARIKAMGVNGAGDSNWIVSKSFRILGEQFLTNVPSSDVIDNQAILRWKSNPTPGLTKIVVFQSAGSTAVEVPLTDSDLALQQKLITGLTPGKAYTAEIYQGTKYKGTATFTTKPTVVGNVVDLRGINAVARPSILTDTMAIIPSGSVVLLKRGSSYIVTAGYSISKSVTVQSGLDFGTNLAAIKFVGTAVNTTVSFNLSGNIDSVVFKDLVIRGQRSAGGISYNFDYLINANTTANVGTIRIANCFVQNLRGTVRLQGSAAKVTNYYIQNSVLDSLREYGIANTTSAGCSYTNFKISNSTVYRTRTLIRHTVAGNSSIIVENCTFNEIAAAVVSPATASNGLIDLGSINSVVSVKNCIFGKPWDELNNGGNVVFGIKSGSSTTTTVDACFNTSDFYNGSANPFPSLTPYSGATTSLFTDPTGTFNFKIKDINFVGKSSVGDPRWRL